jgi:ATP-dependent Clp protease protease subunit
MSEKISFWNFAIKNEGAPDEEVELRIDGEIVEDDDAWIYEWFGIPASSPNAFRTELEKYAGKSITVWIDSWGGATTAGVGIYNAIKEHDGKVTVKIDGKAVSAGSLIAMAGDEILMAPGSIFMIHNPWTGLYGESSDMRHVADVLDEVKEGLINIYELKTGKSRDEISKMMDEETWMSAKKAKAEGFVDGILYAEEKEEEEESIQDDYMFSRLAIQNSVSKSTKKMIEFMQEHEKLPDKPPEPPKKTEEKKTSPHDEGFFSAQKEHTLADLAEMFRDAAQADNPVIITSEMASTIVGILQKNEPQNPGTKNEPTEPTEPEDPRQVPVDLYKKKYKNLERRLRLK